MRFADFIKEGKVRKGEPDRMRARSLIKMSGHQLAAVEKLEINEITCSPVLTMCYEALREVVEALCAKEGFKVYSHEALGFFLRENGEDMVALKFDRYRRLRNGINYYGRSVTVAEALAAKKEIKEMIEKLRAKYDFATK